MLPFESVSCNWQPPVPIVPFRLSPPILPAAVTGNSEEIRGIKNVTMNEPFFQGHFPGYPGDAGRCWSSRRSRSRVDPRVENRPAVDPSDGTIIFFAAIDNARFRRQVRARRSARRSKPRSRGSSAESASSRRARRSTARSSPKPT